MLGVTITATAGGFQITDETFSLEL